MTYREVLGSAAAQKILKPSPSGEDNWKSSMMFCQTLSEAVEKYGTSDLPSNFYHVIEPFINSMLECAISERTQLSVAACRAIGSLPKVLFKDFHPFIDRILPVLIKHTASTKAVNQKSADAAIASMIAHSTYSPRLLWHISQAFEDRNTGPRLYAPSWLQLIIQHYQKFLNPDRDYDTIINCITMGLLDADNNVRIKSRPVFWTYHRIDPEGADAEIKSKLNPHATTALENDPSNPDRKPEKAKVKKQSARPESSLAQLRQQAKKKLLEKGPEQHKEHTTHPVTGANFVVGHLELGNEHQELRTKKSSRDMGHKHTTPAAQNDAHHISKPASRPISVHKKGLSHDSQASQVTKKPSTMDISVERVPKKSGSSDALRTSQNQKSTSSTTEPQAARSLMSAPVRRPRIVATPINTVQQSSSRPSSRTGHVQLHNNASDSSMRATKDSASLLTQQMSKLTVDSGRAPESTPSAPRPQPVKISKKASKPEVSSPLIIPDGKENANIYHHAKSTSRTERVTSPVRRPLEVSQERAEPAQQQQQPPPAPQLNQSPEDFTSDTELRSARRALNTALELLKTNQLDYMGFRKLKNLVYDVGRDLIEEQDQYNVLMEQLITRLGSIEELVDRGDPSDMRHPTYIRQAILHMVASLLQVYHPAWSNRYIGTTLAAMMLARCAYSPNIRNNDKDHPVAGQPYQNRNSTVELISESIDQIIHFCTNPLDVLDSVLDALAAGEQYVLDHADVIEQKSLGSPDNSWRTTFASYDRYSKRDRLWVNYYQQYHHQHEQGQPQSRNKLFADAEPVTPSDQITSSGWEEARPGSSHSGPDYMPSKLPFLIETGLKVITALIEKARNMGQSLYPEQEAMLGDLAQHVLRTYNNALIRRQVMPFCEQLYMSSDTKERFWNNFPAESDRNLLHYYLADVRD